MKNILRFWIPVLLWMIVIFVFSSKTKVAVSDSYTVSFVIFKTLHLIEYGFLYLVSYRAFRNTFASKKASLLYAFFLTLLYAATDEMHQSFVPTREGKVRDVIIDSLGGILGWILVATLLPKARGKLKKLAKNWQILS